MVYKKVGAELAHTYKEFKDLTNLPLSDKIIRSEQLILKALKTYKTPAVSCSWGKDSIAMLHLIRKHCKKAIVLFANTKVEYPQTYKYRDVMLELWDLNYHESTPIKSFWKCVEEYGYPSTTRTDKAKTPKCCMYCKEKPLRQLQKDLGADCAFIGLRATESMSRRLLFIREGELYYAKSQDIAKCYPIMIWQEKDILQYIGDNQIPMNDVYKITKRNGCMPCTGFKNWRAVMAKMNPKLYQKVSRDLGQATLHDCFERTSNGN